MASTPNPHIFGLWEQTRAPGGNPRRHRRTCKLHTDSDPSWESNPGPWRCETAVLTTVPLCSVYQHLFSSLMVQKNTNYWVLSCLREICDDVITLLRSTNFLFLEWKGEKWNSPLTSDKTTTVSLFTSEKSINYLSQFTVLPPLIPTPSNKESYYF